MRGGEQRIATLGLNWYPNQVLKFMLQAQNVQVEPDRRHDGGRRSPMPIWARISTPRAALPDRVLILSDFAKGGGALHRPLFRA